MSLIINNKITKGQIEQLKKLEYLGRFNLTFDEASEIIDALFEEQRLHRSKLEDWKYQM